MIAVSEARNCWVCDSVCHWTNCLLQWLRVNGVYRKLITELRSVTCHMGSHSVTCHLRQVNVPCLNPSHANWYSIYLPRRDGRLSWRGRLVIYRDGLPVGSQSPIQVLTELGVGQLCWSDTMLDHANSTVQSSVYSVGHWVQRSRGDVDEELCQWVSVCLWQWWWWWWWLFVDRGHVVTLMRKLRAAGEWVNSWWWRLDEMLATRFDYSH